MIDILKACRENMVLTIHSQNPQDIPLFLSVRLVEENNKDKDTTHNEDSAVQSESGFNNPIEFLTRYEKNAADLANEFEDNMVRFQGSYILRCREIDVNK